MENKYTTLADLLLNKIKVEEIVRKNKEEIFVCCGDGILYMGTQTNLKMVDFEDDETYNLFFKLLAETINMEK